MILDRVQDSVFRRLEATRRLGDDWKLELTLQDVPRTAQGSPRPSGPKTGTRLQLFGYF